MKGLTLMLTLLLMGCSGFTLRDAIDVAEIMDKEPQVDVKVYKHRESGNYIYCETGTLTDEFHDYIGESQIGESEAVGC